MGRMIEAYLYQSGEAELRWMGETSTYFLATGALTGGAFALVEERAMRGESVPLHKHSGDVESFYLLEGEISFFLGDGMGRESVSVLLYTFQVVPYMGFVLSQRRHVISF